MWNPLSWVMEAAAIMAIVLANGGVSHILNSNTFFFFSDYFCLINGFSPVLFQGEGPDWQDFVGIICLLIINSTISFIEENNAGNAAAALMARLAPKTKVCINFYFHTQESIMSNYPFMQINIICMILVCRF